MGPARTCRVHLFPFPSIISSFLSLASSIGSIPFQLLFFLLTLQPTDLYFSSIFSFPLFLFPVRLVLRKLWLTGTVLARSGLGLIVCWQADPVLQWGTCDVGHITVCTWLSHPPEAIWPTASVPNCNRGNRSAAIPWQVSHLTMALVGFKKLPSIL